jgi:hypothetical protein
MDVELLLEMVVCLLVMLYIATGIICIAPSWLCSENNADAPLRDGGIIKSESLFVFVGQRRRSFFSVSLVPGGTSNKDHIFDFGVSVKDKDGKLRSRRCTRERR